VKRRRLPPDTRPNWRDPQMPVTRDYHFGDGSRKTAVDPDYERRYREMLMQTNPESTFPSWRNDPTYNMRKDRK
jgi:hypothetical protein